MAALNNRGQSLLFIYPWQCASKYQNPVSSEGNLKGPFPCQSSSSTILHLHRGLKSIDPSTFSLPFLPFMPSFSLCTSLESSLHNYFLAYTLRLCSLSFFLFTWQKSLNHVLPRCAQLNTAGEKHPTGLTNFTLHSWPQIIQVLELLDRLMIFPESI